MINSNEIRNRLRKLWKKADTKGRLLLERLKVQSAGFLQWTKKKSRILWEWVRANFVRALVYFSLAAFGFTLILVILTWAGAFGKLPTNRQLEEITNSVASIIYGSNGEVIGHYYIQNRSNIDSSEINEDFKNALIATEDIRFYNHGGIDIRSLGRVIVKNLILQQRRSGGGSTLTQQLAKNVFGRTNRFLLSTLITKIREMIIACRLERIYTKDEILLLYLNTVSFGENIYGLEKAANRFFNKTPMELDLQECATLVGVLKAPSYYNPRVNPDMAQSRRNLVLSQMCKYGFIDSLRAEEAMQSSLELNYQVSNYTASFAAFYKDYLENEFDEWAAKNPSADGSLYDLHTDGLKLYTTLHPSIQRSAERAMEGHMQRLQGNFNEAWDIQSPEDASAEEFVNRLALNLPKAKAMARNGISRDSILAKLNEKADRQMNTLEGYEILHISVIDSIIRELTTLQSGILALHSPTGKILAYVGGVNYGYSQYDNVQIPRQVGSTFKPITYLAALENGEDPCNFYDNQLATYSRYEGWTPRNANGYYGGSYSMHGALAHSINTVSVQIMLKTGINRVISMARKMGIESKLPGVPSLVLGTADISLMELVKAYSCISNGGYRIDPYTITRIEDEEGNVLYRAGSGVVSGQIAATENLEALRRMMRETTLYGTAARISAYGIPYNIIGKTGTTQNNSDGWFVGCTPEIVVGAWVGTLDRRVHFRSTSMGSGANTALPMVALTFKDLSLWRNPMISNFRYSTPGFPCFDYSDFPADEAQYMIWLDTLPYTDSLALPDTLAPVKLKLDSLEVDSSILRIISN